MKFALYIFVILIISVKCNSGPKLEGVPMTNFYEYCDSVEYFDFGNIITIGDPNDKFMISLPYSWDIQETYSDTIYGLHASNLFDSRTHPENYMSISVTGFYSEANLLDYVKKEIKSLKKDRKIDLSEIGKITIKEKESYWLKFDSEEEKHKLVNIVHYIKSNKSNEIFLIQSTVYNTVNQNDIICYLKLLINTFELMD